MQLVGTLTKNQARCHTAPLHSYGRVAVEAFKASDLCPLTAAVDTQIDKLLIDSAHCHVDDNLTIRMTFLSYRIDFAP